MADRLPFVVAIVPDFLTGLGPTSLLRILYGAPTLDEVLRKSPREILQCPPARTDDGLFWRAPALSAAAWVNKNNYGQWFLKAYHNPSAANPLPIDAFDEV